MTSTTLVGPVLAAVLLLGGWMLAQTRDEHGLPRRGLVSLGETVASLGLLLGVLAVPLTLPPETYAAALAAVLLVGLALIRGAGRLAIGWTSGAEIVTSAVGLGWARPRRALWSVLAVAVGLAVWLAGRGEPAAGLLGAAVALAPARWWLPWGASRERARTGVERALAGALAGGTEWDSHEANLRGSPVRVAFDGEQKPWRISAPLPPGWKASSEENLSTEVNSRLSEWGTPWITAVDHSRRRVVATKGEPLPDFLPWDGQPAGGHQVTLGLARVSPAAAAAGVGRLGEVKPFVWDLDDTPSGIIVGTAGGGKSVLVRLIVTSLAMSGWDVWLLDPKRVEMTPFVGRRNIVSVTDTLPTMAQAMTALSVEVDRRYEVLKREGVQKNSELRSPFRPILVVVDEYFELVSKEPGSDDETKAENELRAGIGSGTRHTAAYARAADVHMLPLAQRADADVVKGSLQNNLRFRALMRPATAGATARNMIGMPEVEPSGNPRGRAVMMTDSWPESEVQVAFLDAAALDRYLPKVEHDEMPVDREEEPTDRGSDQDRTKDDLMTDSAGDQSGDGDDGQDDSESKPSPERGKRLGKDRDDDQDGTEQSPDPGSGNDRAPDDDDPDPADAVDPLDFFGDDD